MAMKLAGGTVKIGGQRFRFEEAVVELGDGGGFVPIDAAEMRQEFRRMVADEPTAFTIHPRAITSEELMQAVKEMRRTRPPRGEDMSSINALLREIRDQATKPFSADLSSDPLACSILRQWARQPWQEAHREALFCRIYDLGFGEKETAWTRWHDAEWCGAMSRCFASWKRQHKRGQLRDWKTQLVEQFGDFESLHFVGT